MVSEDGPGKNGSQGTQHQRIVDHRGFEQIPGHAHRDRNQQGHRRKGTSRGQGDARGEDKREGRHQLHRKALTDQFRQVGPRAQRLPATHRPQTPGQHEDPQCCEHAGPSEVPADESFSERERPGGQCQHHAHQRRQHRRRQHHLQGQVAAQHAQTRHQHHDQAQQRHHRVDGQPTPLDPFGQFVHCHSSRTPDTRHRTG